MSDARTAVGCAALVCGGAVTVTWMTIVGVLLAMMWRVW